jgi:beta-glucosidase
VPGVVAPGDSTTVTGSGFPAGQPVLIRLFSEPVTVGTTTTDGAGSFRLVVTIPVDTPPGVHTLVATGPGGVPRADTSITVSAPAGVRGVIAELLRPLPVTVLLARTGSAAEQASRLALILIVAGTFLVAGSWTSAARAVAFPRRSRKGRRPYRTFR